jgi:hypothetical protein
MVTAMTGASSNFHRSLEQSFSYAVRKPQRGAGIALHGYVVKDKLFSHLTETRCELGETTLLS